MYDPNLHFGRAGTYAGDDDPPPRPVLGHEIPHRPPGTHRYVAPARSRFSVGAPVSPGEACAMVRMLRRHGYVVREPQMQIGAPISAHDADAVARILQDHGYHVMMSSSRGGRRRKRRRGGLLVGFARALTGSR